MSFVALISTALAWLVVVMVPGPNFFATVQAAAIGSRRAGLAVAAGIGIGTTIWAAAAAAGLAAVFQAVGWVYPLLRVAGAAYLIVFGISMLWRAARTSARSGSPGQLGNGPRRSVRRSFVRGLATDLSNPKAAVFFTSLFAVAIPPQAAPLEAAVFVAVMPTIAVAWYVIVAVALSAGPIARAFDRVERVLNAAAGTLLTAFGIRLALEH